MCLFRLKVFTAHSNLFTVDRSLVLFLRLPANFSFQYGARGAKVLLRWGCRTACERVGPSSQGRQHRLAYYACR